MTQMRRQVMLTALACLGVLAIGWVLLVSPKRGEAATVREDVTAQQQVTAQLRTQLAMLKAQAKGLTKQQAVLAQLAQQIPPTPALPTLLRKLSAAADDAGADLKTLTPSQPTLLAPPAAPVAPAAAEGESAAPAPSAAAAAAPVSSTPLAVIPVNIGLSGDYYALEQFLDNLESLPRSFQVSGFQVAPQAVTADSGSGAALSSGDKNVAKLALTLTGRVYMQAGVAPAVAEAAASAAPKTSATPSASASPKK